MTTPAAFRKVDPAFDVVAVSSTIQVPDPRYHRLSCHDGNVDAAGHAHLRMCVWLRPGGCDPAVAPINEPYWPDYFRAKMGLPPFDWTIFKKEAGG